MDNVLYNTVDLSMKAKDFAYMITMVGKIDRDKFKAIAENIVTDEVIITDKQIEHIEERHKGVLDQYIDEIETILSDPDYIFKDPKHTETALVVKRFENSIELVLRLSTDTTEKKNSIITMWEIKEARLQRYILTHETVYKKE